MEVVSVAEKLITLSNLERYVKKKLEESPSGESGDAKNIPSEDIGGNIWIEEGE